MSMNIHITSKGEVTFPSGLKMPFGESFNCRKTPTVVTDQILASPNPIEAYKEWVLSRSEDQERDIYDENEWDDTTCYFKVIGKETYNWGEEHCRELDSFIMDAEEKGMLIDIYSM